MMWRFPAIVRNTMSKMISALTVNEKKGNFTYHETKAYEIWLSDLCSEIRGESAEVNLWDNAAYRQTTQRLVFQFTRRMELFPGFTFKEQAGRTEVHSEDQNKEWRAQKIRPQWRRYYSEHLTSPSNNRERASHMQKSQYLPAFVLRFPVFTLFATYPRVCGCLPQ